MNAEELYCLKAHNQLTVEEWKLGHGVSDEEFRARYQAKTPRPTDSRVSGIGVESPVRHGAGGMAGAGEVAFTDSVGAQEA